MGETAGMTNRRTGGAWAPRWWSRRPRGSTSVLAGRRSPRTPSRWSRPLRLAGSASGVSRPRAATRVANFELDDVCRQIATQVKKTCTDTLLVQALHTLASPNLQTMDEVERLQRLRAEKGDIVELELTRLHVQRFACERDATDAAHALQAATIIACAL
jgi:hypothetical protein